MKKSVLMVNQVIYNEINRIYLINFTHRLNSKDLSSETNGTETNGTKTNGTKNLFSRDKRNQK